MGQSFAFAGRAHFRIDTVFDVGPFRFHFRSDPEFDRIYEQDLDNKTSAQQTLIVCLHRLTPVSEDANHVYIHIYTNVHMQWGKSSSHGRHICVYNAVHSGHRALAGIDLASDTMAITACYTLHFNIH